MLRRSKVFGAAAVLAGVALGAPGSAHADTFIPLPGGTINRTLGDGTEVTVSIDGESANINPSMGDTPVHRNVWTSGRGVVDVAGPKAGSARIKIYPGYVVGCQVAIEGLTSAGTENGSETFAAGVPPVFANTLGDTETLVIGPGQAVVRYLLDLEKPDDYGNESHKQYNEIHGPHASVMWTDETFAVDGCGGYAQARSFVTADVATDNTESMVTVWGAPFTIG
ncbi:MspA family porin [Nocardia sp. NPDC003482]|uniref:MspA family porin n=1 Tax=Nocardia sp. NPDC004068 TaxID=3364303 RepID=UPI0036D05E81